MTGDVEEGENKNLQEASKPIDITGVMPGGLSPKNTDQGRKEESKIQDLTPAKK